MFLFFVNHEINTQIEVPITYYTTRAHAGPI